MKLILFGATGMVGSAILRESLRHPDVEKILLIGRRPYNLTHDKVQCIVHQDFHHFESLQETFSHYDACAYAIGVTSLGLSEQDYTTMTYEYTLAASRALLAANAKMAIVFVSAQGADSREQGPPMWARIKGKTENALLAMPFGSLAIVRPGAIVPLHGIVSRTAIYRWLYAGLKPFLPLLQYLLGPHLITTEQLGQGVLKLLQHRPQQTIWHNPDIDRLLKDSSNPTATHG